MNKFDRPLDRLLRAAAEAKGELPNEMPFGFATRVLAGWRSAANRDYLDVGRLLRRVVLISICVIAISSAGLYHELNQSEDMSELFLDQDSIADSAISNAIEL